MRRKLAQNETLIMTVTGGSVSANTAHWGYVQSLAVALQSYFAAKVELRNYAVGGRTSHVAYYCTKLSGDEDLVMVP